MVEQHDGDVTQLPEWVITQELLVYVRRDDGPLDEVARCRLRDFDIVDRIALDELSRIDGVVERLMQDAAHLQQVGVGEAERRLLANEAVEKGRCDILQIGHADDGQDVLLENPAVNVVSTFTNIAAHDVFHPLLAEGAERDAVARDADIAVAVIRVGGHPGRIGIVLPGKATLLDDTALPVCSLAGLEDVAVGLPALADTDGSHIQNLLFVV